MTTSTLYRSALREWFFCMQFVHPNKAQRSESVTKNKQHLYDVFYMKLRHDELFKQYVFKICRIASINILQSNCIVYFVKKQFIYFNLKKIKVCLYRYFFLLKIGYHNQNSPLTTEPILLKELYACIMHFSPPPQKKSKVLHRALTIRLKIVKIMFKVSV